MSLHSNPLPVRPVSWAEEGARLSAIRRRVFLEEQQVPESEEWDGLDEEAQHFLVPWRRDTAIGAARVVMGHLSHESSSLVYHIGRVAVLPEYRGQGIGSRMMLEVIHWCQRQAQPERPAIHLNAQVDRLGFYRRLGFLPRGNVFMEAGIRHQAMSLENHNGLYEGEGA